MLREGEGTGLLWRLFSITRFEERDGGIYIELEAIALSRDIRASLRWMIEPIVRRVSKSSLITSLQQTEGAVRASVALADSRPQSREIFRAPLRPADTYLHVRGREP
jgi:hypothetical protein